MAKESILLMREVEETWQEYCRESIRPSVLLAVEVARAYPSNAEFWSTLGLVQYAAEDYRSAMESLEQATKLRPEDDHSDGFLQAAVQWRLGDRQRAEGLYRKAVEWIDNHRPHDGDLARLRSHVEILMDEDRRDSHSS
jgi:tetratricopeptide (TPR) repeat protein